jgi:signal transduction histidine kinase
MNTSQLNHTLLNASHIPLEFFQAWFSAQPRAVRVFDPDLRVLWDNTPDRVRLYPVYRNSEGRVLDRPPQGRLWNKWPVARVLKGESRASCFCSRTLPQTEDRRSFRVSAWAWTLPSNGPRYVIEEIEEIDWRDGPNDRIALLDREVDDLLSLLTEQLQFGPTDQVLRLRLSNPNAPECQEFQDCARLDCPGQASPKDVPCWEVPGTLRPGSLEMPDLLEKMRYCNRCDVFLLACPDPLTRVAENFNRLITMLQFKYLEALDAQRRLQQAEKLAVLGELLAGIAHEVKNPLGIIMSRLDLLSLDSEMLSEEELFEDLEVIRQQVGRMRDIIDHLMKMARPGPPERHDLSLNVVVLETLPMVRKTLMDADIHLELDLGQGMPAVKADLVQLQQVLINLLLNARDAMPEGGRVIISTELQNDRERPTVQARIRDTGVGMSPDQIRQAFEPFHSTKLDQGGTGLGLAVCQRILHQHDGGIDAEPHPEGGTVVRIWLPASGGNE